jgi:hypothetical protein
LHCPILMRNPICGKFIRRLHGRPRAGR